MKKFLPVFVIAILVSAFSFNVSAQCKGFAKKICKQELIPYIHDGNYHAAILTEGEEAELYKTFYEGQQYRIAVCGAENLPAVEFRVYDSGQNLLYDNKDHNLSTTWDFNLSSSQQLKIVVKVPVKGDKKSNPADIVSGCVAIMFGFKQ